MVQTFGVAVGVNPASLLADTRYDPVIALPDTDGSNCGGEHAPYGRKAVISYRQGTSRMTLKQLLTEMLKYKASDLHVRVNVRPHLRIDGLLQQIPCDPVTAEEMDSYVTQMLSDVQKERFAKKMELDLALSVVKLGRFRINLYRQRGTVGIAIRAVNDIIPSLEELNLPDVVEKIANARRGLVVVTGVTGSGKSTTLASMLEYMNETRNDNIITIEDPIE